MVRKELGNGDDDLDIPREWILTVGRVFEGRSWHDRDCI